MNIYILLKPGGDDNSIPMAASHDVELLKAFAAKDTNDVLEWYEVGDGSWESSSQGYSSYTIEQVPVLGEWL